MDIRKSFPPTKINPFKEIKEAFILGHLEKCLNLVNSEFQRLRTFQCLPETVKRPTYWGVNRSTGNDGLLLHKCQRAASDKVDGSEMQDCDCTMLGHYLIAIGHQKGLNGVKMHQFLQGAFYYQPHLRLPFSVLLAWIQLEIHVKNYEFASDSLIKPYILNSNKFKSETETVTQAKENKDEDKKEDLSQVRPWLRG